MNGGERRPDRLGLGRLHVYQDEGIFKFTVDPILAADFIRADPKERVVDLGTGGGVIPIWLAGYRGFQNVDGLELQPEVAALARQNVILNGLEEQIRIHEGDLREPPEALWGSPVPWVISNPPYLPATSRLTGNSAVDRAKFELTCTLEDLVLAARRLTTGNGRLVMVHLPERLPEICGVFKRYGFEPKLMRLVHAGPGKPPNRLLIEGQKGGKPHLHILPPLYIRDEQGAFTEEMREIYEGRAK